MMDFKEGEVLFFNKPLGWTSFKVVGHARYHICRRIKVKKLKVGHAGTLDPLATGVMIVCTGKATKRIEEFQYHTKEYVATIRLGATTPSYDLEHEIDATYPTEHITRELVEETLKRFVGEIQQVPPAFSACMVNGKRAYDLARKGEEVELKPKLLVIAIFRRSKSGWYAARGLTSALWHATSVKLCIAVPTSQLWNVHAWGMSV